MSLAFTEEQELLRSTARKFLQSRAGTDKVRETMITEEGFAPALWSEIAGMGWQAMAIPEEFGGAGYGFSEVAVLMEEMGRALFCAPFLSSAILGAGALLEAGNDQQRRNHLPGIASGEQRFAFAHLGEGGAEGADKLAVTASSDGDGWSLAGSAPFVLDGHTADTIIVAAKLDDGVGLFVVPGDADGLERERLDTLDETRKQATLTFSGVTVGADVLLGDGPVDWGVVERIVDRGVVALAAEQVGLAQQVLENTVDYAKTRKQFGRAIGSFQAIKHGLADMLVEVESAKSLAYNAANALAEGDDDELALAAPMAKSYCSDAAFHAAADSIQIFGGIGFTWEHDAHLYFKRAKTGQLLFGEPSVHRARVADVLGL